MKYTPRRPGPPKQMKQPSLVFHIRRQHIRLRALAPRPQRVPRRAHLRPPPKLIVLMLRDRHLRLLVPYGRLLEVRGHARHGHRRRLAASVGQLLRDRLSVEERGGFFQGAAFGLDDEVYDEEELEDEPAAIDEVLRSTALVGVVGNEGTSSRISS